MPRLVVHVWTFADLWLESLARFIHVTAIFSFKNDLYELILFLFTYIVLPVRS